MTLRINRSWEDDDCVVGPLAQTFRSHPEQFQVLESFVLDRLAAATPPTRRKERLAFVAERGPQLSKEILRDKSCRDALERMARERPDREASGAASQRTPEAMVACAVSLVLSRWMLVQDAARGGSPEATRPGLG